MNGSSSGKYLAVRGKLYGHTNPCASTCDPDINANKLAGSASKGEMFLIAVNVTWRSVTVIDVFLFPNTSDCSKAMLNLTTMGAKEKRLTLPHLNDAYFARLVPEGHESAEGLASELASSKE